ncbi:MAG: DinB family protein [Terracidiphilus sp.]
MPVPAVIATAAENYRFNSDFLTKMVGDLSPEEWLRHPEGNPNHIAWIVGHVVWTRRAVLSRLSTDWTLPWLDHFARGKQFDDATCPSRDTLFDGWREASGVLATALDNASEEALAQPSVKGPPSADGKISGVVNFLAVHETYHIGQASYLRGWLGHKGLMG